MKILAQSVYAILRIPMISYFLKKILPWWEQCDLVPEETIIDAVAIVSYATHSQGLTEGSQAIVEKAIEVGNSSPRYPLYVYGVFAHPFSAVERARKMSLLQETWSICVGKVTSTTDECIVLLAEIKKHLPDTKVIIVSAEGAHAPRARLVWQYFVPKYFPGAKVYVVTSSTILCADRRNPMFPQRYWQVWLVTICFCTHCINTFLVSNGWRG